MVVTSGVAYAVYFASWGAWSPYWPVYVTGLGASLAVVGVLAALPAAVQVVAGPAWGLVADRLGDVRPPLLASSAIGVAAALFLAAGPSTIGLLAGIAFLAVGTSAWSPLIDARTVTALGPHRDRFGQARAIGSAGFVAATPLVGLLIDAHGPQALFAAYIPLVLLAVGWVAVRFGRTGVRRGVVGVGPLAAAGLLRERAMALLFAGSVLVWAATSGPMAFLSLRLSSQGADAGLIGIGWAVSASVEVPMMIAFGRLARRTGLPALIVGGAGAMALRTLGWALAGTATATVAVASTSGIGFSLVLIGVTAWLADHVPATLRATAQALFLGTSYAVGTIAGSLAAGWAAAAVGLDAMFLGASALALAGTVILWVALDRPGWRVRAANPGPAALGPGSGPVADENRDSPAG